MKVDLLISGNTVVLHVEGNHVSLHKLAKMFEDAARKDSFWEVLQYNKKHYKHFKVNGDKFIL